LIGGSIRIPRNLVQNQLPYAPEELGLGMRFIALRLFLFQVFDRIAETLERIPERWVRVEAPSISDGDFDSTRGSLGSSHVYPFLTEAFSAAPKSGAC
jgi:hypothetical protein